MRDFQQREFDRNQQQGPLVALLLEVISYPRDVSEMMESKADGKDDVAVKCPRIFHPSKSKRCHVDLKKRRLEFTFRVVA